MNIKHCVFLSWFSAQSPQSHEQDGERLFKQITLRTVSGDPAMTFRTLPLFDRTFLVSPGLGLSGGAIAAGPEGGCEKASACLLTDAFGIRKRKRARESRARLKC
jgi:hypothetical protein